eukprot:scaffold125100_cov58-Phaeocystis_antarctica.AAC.4
MQSSSVTSLGVVPSFSKCGLGSRQKGRQNLGELAGPIDVYRSDGLGSEASMCGGAPVLASLEVDIALGADPGRLVAA